MKWNPESWKNFSAKQQPAYKNQNHLNEILKKIKGFPPLVSIGGIELLKKQITQSSLGNSFILQGGDCAERFIDCNEPAILNKIKILLQMSVILTYGARKPVVRIGRIAGQYAKPRSNDYEIIDGKEVPVYRGDCVNDYDHINGSREPDPEKLLHSFNHSVITLNYIRAIISGGFADLHHPHFWDLADMKRTTQWKRYENTIERILDAISFMESFGGLRDETLGKVDFYTSHEGLLLDYEEALTRKSNENGKYYNRGAHMLWIGERTRGINDAHVEYFRGIENPIGIKMSSTMDPHEITDLISYLNPQNSEGKIVLITRFGASKVEESLPTLVRAVDKSNLKVAWSCDPMHGNITKTSDGQKTRNFNNILDELRTTFAVHKSEKSILSGVHFELTGDDITECIGGAVDVKDIDLAQRYETYCDPRLNYSQSLEMAFLISELLNS